MPEMKRPAAPQTIDGEALAEWDRIVSELEAAGMLAETDRAVLTLYVETWSTWRKAARHVTEFGPVVKLGNGVVCRSPFAVVAKETAAQLRNLLADLGLTPAARAKVKTSPQDDPPADLDI